MKPLDTRTSEAMAKVKGRRTSPEQRVAAVLRSLGIHYRRNVRTLPGTPDFANRSKGWVIQVHGCFWHQHDCPRGVVPRHNAELWTAKFAQNRRRDLKAEGRLRDLGLNVFTVWECETRTFSELKGRISALFAESVKAESSSGNDTGG